MIMSIGLGRRLLHNNTKGVWKMKKTILKSLITIFALILFIIPYTTISAYTCETYSIDVPESYEIDSTTLDDFTSFYGDNVTIGIQIKNNFDNDDVSTYTDDKINKIADEAINALATQGGEGITVTEKTRTSFSANNYSSVLIVYEGSSKADYETYMEEYIISTSNYIYTIIFSANTKEELATDEVDLIKQSFTSTDSPIIYKKPISNNKALTILAISATLVIIIFLTVIIYIMRNGKHKNK